MKDTQFYDTESAQYSRKRYPLVAQSYTQFFFNRRLALTKQFVGRVLSASAGVPVTLLEVGCADGVVVRELARAFHGAFKKMVGIDISPSMIAEARRQNTDSNAEFLLREEYGSRPPVNIVIETGVINYANFEEDLQFAFSNLQTGGYYLLSVAGTESLRNRLKHESGFNDFRSYRVYDRLIREKFTVLGVRGCGVFMPYLWRIPAIARLVQPMLEVALGTLVPGLCHEKLYLLKKHD